MYNSLQQGEIFHLEFLRWFGRKVEPNYYALKGGANLRFFFGSIRYSEYMDLDLTDIRVDIIQDLVLDILNSPGFIDNLKTYGIQRIISPNMEKAKQTETTQRFKVHLINMAGEDLFTKIEFLIRDLGSGVITRPILDSILRAYKLIPLLAPHYNIVSTVIQKVTALALRPAIQARDIFDLYMLSPRFSYPEVTKSIYPGREILGKANENLFSVKFEQFRDSVIPYLPTEEQANYNSKLYWDEIRLKVAKLIDGLRENYG